LVGFLVLAARILLLLSGFLPATLLLARLLSGILVLLAGFLVRIGHRDLLFQVCKKSTAEPGFGCAELQFPLTFRGFIGKPRFPRRLGATPENYLCTSP
jgi:hypothetical protein